LINGHILRNLAVVGVVIAIGVIGYGPINTERKRIAEKSLQYFSKRAEGRNHLTLKEALAIVRNSTEERLRNRFADGIFIHGTPEQYKDERNRLAILRRFADENPEFKKVFDRVNKDPSFCAMQRLTSHSIFGAYLNALFDRPEVMAYKLQGIKVPEKAQEKYNNSLKALIEEVKKEFNLE